MQFIIWAFDIANNSVCDKDLLFGNRVFDWIFVLKTMEFVC